MSAAIKTPLTYGDAMVWATALENAHPFDRLEQIRKALMATDQASRDQQKQECAGHVSPFELSAFLIDVKLYLERHLDVDEPVPGRKVTNEAGHLHRVAARLLAKVEEALASEQGGTDMDEGFGRNLVKVFGPGDLLHGMAEKPLQAVTLNDAKDRITFAFQDGSKAAFCVEGDCCSSSWIEHLTVPADITGAVLETYVDERVSTKFGTAKGDIVLEYRNSSNGYYGGYLVRMSDEPPAPQEPDGEKAKGREGE